MTDTRHILAQALITIVGLGVAACATSPSMPEMPQGPPIGRVGLSHRVPLVDGAAHFVVRTDLRTVDNAIVLQLTGSAPGFPIVLVPDDPDVMPISSPERFELDLRESLAAGCGADDVCEAGFTVEVRAIEAPPPDITFNMEMFGYGITSRLELEVDGEPIVRGSVLGS